MHKGKGGHSAALGVLRTHLGLPALYRAREAFFRCGVLFCAPHKRRTVLAARCCAHHIEE